MKLFHYGNGIKKLSLLWQELGTSLFSGSLVRKSSSLSSDFFSKITYSVGTQIHGFKVEDVCDVPELHLRAFKLTHQQTSARYLHISRNDDNNVFSIGFKTIPLDSTGVPHILEHIVLCGSQKYPCKDPFFKMYNRSLATYMNALTSFDFTQYPFSTQHPVDFRNLMSVYLDAVFRPNIHKEDFYQEGWRLAHEGDRDSPIIFKGVVFNEMKGVFSDSHSLFMQKLLNGVLPSHTYSVVYGGDPLCIPQLTWEGLKKFYFHHYHPSNSVIFTYGNFPLEDHLHLINDQYLKFYDRIDPKTNIPDEVRWTEPRMEYITCPFDPLAQEDAQTSIAVSFMLGSVDNTFENFVFHIISELLVSGPNCPFYKSLIETQLGTGFSPSLGFLGQTKNTLFTIGLQGVKAEDADKVYNSINETFQSVAETGFTDERVESILHNIELSVKHQTSNFGFGLAVSVMPLYNHGVEPFSLLQINNNIKKFRDCLKADKAFLQNKVKEHFLNNKHKFTLVMSPDVNYLEELKKKEDDMLKRYVSELTDDQKDNIWNQSLLSEQQPKDDPSCLPTLKVEDISRNITPSPVTNIHLQGSVALQLCEQPTNEMAYLNILLSTHGIPEDLRPLLPVFCSILTSMGTSTYNFREFDQMIELKTGGLSSQLHISDHPTDSSKYEEGILLSSHSLNVNFCNMLSLWSFIFNELSFTDETRFVNLIKMISSNTANNLIYSGHSFAMTHSARSISYASQLKEEWTGLTYVQHLKELSESPDLISKLEQLRRLASVFFGNKCMRTSVSTTPEFSTDAVKGVENFLASINAGNTATCMRPVALPAYTPTASQYHHVFPFPVNYIGKSFMGVHYSHSDAGPMRVLARLMFQYLHREIREKGGAYGGGATCGVPVFSFYSYRDPESLRTFDAFDGAINWVLSGDFSQREIDEAKLGVFQKVDAPIPPGSRGDRRFLYHIPDELFQEHRRGILRTNREDLIHVAQKYLKEPVVSGSCLIGPENDSVASEHWTKVRH